MPTKYLTSRISNIFLCMLVLVGCAKTKTVASTRDAPKQGSAFKSADPEPPGTIQSPKMKINNGAEATNQIVVNLNLSVLGADQVYITNSSDCSDGGKWQSYVPVVEWTLPLENTENTIYAKFQDRRGAQSACVGTSIIHDNIGPIMSGELDHDTWINSRTSSPDVSWQEATDGLGVGLKEYELAIGTEPGTDDLFPWTPIGTVLKYQVTGVTLALKKAYYTSVRAVDELGNKSDVLTGDGWQSTEWKARYFFKSSASVPRASQFGKAVALANGLVAVGMPNDGTGQDFISGADDMPYDFDASASGAVTVFEKNSAGWSPSAYIKAANVSNQDQFGHAIALSSTTLVVGVPLEDSRFDSIINAEFAVDDNSATDSGAVYVYRRAGNNWKQEAFIKAPNSDDGDLFGYSVSLYGDTLLVGAPGEDSAGEQDDNSSPNAGAAYVFVRKGSQWEFHSYLKAPNPAAEDHFGFSVSVGESSLVIGAPYEDGGEFAVSFVPESAGMDKSAPSSGAAYVFGRQSSTWVAQAYLKGYGGGEGDGFGYAVTIADTGLIAVSAPYEDGEQRTQTGSVYGTLTNKTQDSGAVYVFANQGNKWQPSAFLKASNVSSNADFGFSLDSYNDRIIVGSIGERSSSTRTLNGVNIAPTDAGVTAAGSAYVFFKGDTGWYQEAYMKAPNNTANNRFGYGVAIHDTEAIVTSPFESSRAAGVSAEFPTDNSLSSVGAGYLFSVFE